MKVVIKRNNRLVEFDECVAYSKGELRLNEDITATIPQSTNIKQAQMKAQQLMNQNSGVGSASIDAGKADGQNDQGSGEGMKFTLPINANGKQLAQAERLTRDQNADDVEIEFTKQNASSSSLGTNESRIREMRRNSIPFSKNELNKFLMGL